MHAHGDDDPAGPSGGGPDAAILRDDAGHRSRAASSSVTSSGSTSPSTPRGWFGTYAKAWQASSPAREVELVEEREGIGLDGGSVGSARACGGPPESSPGAGCEAPAASAAASRGQTHSVARRGRARQTWCGIRRPAAQLALLRARGWLALEEPDSSALARVWFIIVTGSLLLAIISFAMSTVPSFRPQVAHWAAPTSPSVEIPMDVFDVIEAASTVVFSLDWLFRLACTPAPKLRFVVGPRSLVDLITLAPFYAYVALMASASSAHTALAGSGLTALGVLRLMRLMRLVKLGMVFPPAQVLVQAILRSWEAVFMLAGLYAFGVVFFASIL